MVSVENAFEPSGAAMEGNGIAMLATLRIAHLAIGDRGSSSLEAVLLLWYCY
jgi:hypothetical protein